MRTDVQAVFSAAATEYGRGNPLLLIERQETPALLPRLEGRDVLDLGCGDGHYARLAATLGARRAIALDAAAAMTALAPPPALVADGGRLALAAGSVDVVVCALMLSYAGDPAAVLREVARVLRGGGVLVLSDLHPEASARGWRRSFATGGGTLEVPAPPLSTERLRAALSAASLAVEDWREPAVDGRLQPEFERAGRRDFAALSGAPLLVVVRARKGAVHG